MPRNEREGQRRGVAVTAFDRILSSNPAESLNGRTAEQPDSNIAEQPPSRTAKRLHRNAQVTSWGIQARHDLRDACRVLAAERKLTMGRLIEEAMIDLLQKYGKDVPGEGD